VSPVKHQRIQREADPRETHKTASVTALLLTDQFAIHCFNSRHFDESYDIRTKLTFVS